MLPRVCGVSSRYLEFTRVNKVDICRLYHMKRDGISFFYFRSIELGTDLEPWFALIMAMVEALQKPFGAWQPGKHGGVMEG